MMEHAKYNPGQARERPQIPDDLYQIFVKKHATIPYYRQEYCPDDEDFRHYLIPDYRIFLQRLGITRANLDAMSCIHVAGTKGKGSTCAMTEKILRTYGFKTGFISSPPLLEIRERVRINGIPVSRAMFGRYGMECFDLLEKNRNKYGETFTEKPGPYGMFSLVAYYILVKEKVDVAVVEVGLGGEYDTTNVLWSPTVTGISSLALEHTSLLGDTLDKIAWHKAGIFKNGCPAFTVEQEENAMEILVQRADERNASLQLCPRLEEYERDGNLIELGLAGKHQRNNAALAIQLTRTWFQKCAPKRITFEAVTPLEIGDVVNGKVQKASAFVLPDEFLRGLALSKWPGRNQTIRKKGVTYYLDNAHTKESVAFCKRWFEEEATKEAQSIPGDVKTILIFNLSGDRDAATILPPLVEYGFDAVVFCVMRTVAGHENEVKDYKVVEPLNEQMLKCHKRLATFQQLLDGIPENNNNVVISLEEGRHCDVKDMPILKVYPSATEALQWAIGHRLNDAMTGRTDTADTEGVFHDASHIQVLVTGSNFIVGSVLHVVEPDMLDKSEYW